MHCRGATERPAPASRMFFFFHCLAYPLAAPRPGCTGSSGLVTRKRRAWLPSQLSSGQGADAESACRSTFIRSLSWSQDSTPAWLHRSQSARRRNGALRRGAKSATKFCRTRRTLQGRMHAHQTGPERQRHARGANPDDERPRDIDHRARSRPMMKERFGARRSRGTPSSARREPRRDRPP